MSTVLVVASADDGWVSPLMGEAARRGCAAVIATEAEIRAGLGMDCVFDGTQMTGSLSVGGARIAVEEVAGIFYRPHPTYGWDLAAGGSEVEYLQSELLAAYFGLFSGLACPVANRPGPAVVTGLPTAGHILSDAVRTSGFFIPPIWMADGGDGAMEFYQRHGRRVLACPPLSDFPRLLEGTEGGSVLSGMSARSGPVLAVPVGRWLRALIVGGAPLAAWVGPHGLSEQVPISADFSARCRQFADRLDLGLVELHLVRDDDRRDYCLRVDSAPAFAPWEAAFGPQVIESLAEFLTGAAVRTPKREMA